MPVKTYKYKIEWTMKHGSYAGKLRVDYVTASTADVAKRKFKKELGGGSDFTIKKVTRV